MKTTGIALLAAVLGIAACGGGDKPTATSCADSWNANTNAKQQATLAGVMTVDIVLDGKYRVGTWPNSEQKVPVTEGFADPKGARQAVVTKGSCLLVLPDTREGRMAFVESDGKWGFVRETSPFPKAALKSVAAARVAEPDALGKLKLQ